MLGEGGSTEAIVVGSPFKGFVRKTIIKALTFFFTPSPDYQMFLASNGNV